jgi:hypothetical protein
METLGLLISQTYTTPTCPFGTMWPNITMCSDPDNILADSQFAADADVKQTTASCVYKTRFLLNRDRRIGVNVK